MNAFSRTLRSIAADEARPRSWALALALIPLGAWAAWFVGAEVTVVESSSSARLEVDAAPHVVQAPVSGLVVAAHLELDRSVKAGDVLLELDASIETLKLEEQRSHVAALEEQLARARGEATAGAVVRREEVRTAAAATEQARAILRGAEASAGLSRVESERFDKLFAQNTVPELDMRRVDAARVERESAATSAAASAVRLEAEGRSRLGDARARSERLLREIAGIEGDIAVSRTAIARLEEEIGRRVIRAPVAGRLGFVVAIRPGATVAEGTEIARVVPDGGLRIVSQFPVASAVGRIRTGQPARVRLDGFPFTAWGTLRAEVRGAGSEAEAGLVRVELDVRNDSDGKPTKIPLQHGLTGTVEVEVERLSPAALVLRLAGKTLSGGSRFPVSGNDVTAMSSSRSGR